MKKTDIQKKIMPLADRVLIRVTSEDETEKKNKFGIYIPETAQKEKSEQGEIVAIGNGKKDENGKVIPFSVKIGDVVMFSKYGYDEVTIEGETFVMVKEENILAILK